MVSTLASVSKVAKKPRKRTNLTEERDVREEDNTRQLFNSISSLNAYESKKAHFIRSVGIKVESFEILMKLCNTYFYTGSGMSVYGLSLHYAGNRYSSIHFKLTTLSQRDLIERYMVGKINYFKPSSKALEAINSLLVK